MQFGVLGSLEVTNEGGALVDLGGAQPRTLVAMLLVAQGRVVAVDTLLDGIWPDRQPTSALGTLQSYVSRVRRAFDPERTGAGAKVLVLEPVACRLDIDPSDVDSWRFEQLAAEGQQLLQRGEAAAAHAVLAEALSLWRGPALVEFADHEFARGPATRLEERRLVAIEDRIQADLALGRHASVIGELSQLVEEYPWREALWGHLAIALYRAGRQADALRAITDMRTTLREELGVEPSRPIRDLEAAILPRPLARAGAHGAGPDLDGGHGRASGGRARPRGRADPAGRASGRGRSARHRPR